VKFLKIKKKNFILLEKISLITKILNKNNLKHLMNNRKNITFINMKKIININYINHSN